MTFLKQSNFSSGAYIHSSTSGDTYVIVIIKDKLCFNLRLGLSCSASWVKHPEFLDLMYTDRIFLISVDPTGTVNSQFFYVSFLC
jgi:hypothetical protein